jgi:hypothetical protein
VRLGGRNPGSVPDPDPEVDQLSARRAGACPPWPPPRGRYQTLDRWESREAYEAFRAPRRAEYDARDHAGEALTASEDRLGDYVRTESPAVPPVGWTGPA